jgi:mannosyl-oligosaccharide alpha-1,2-mannosidase
MGTMNFVQVKILQLRAKLAETVESYFYAYRLTGNKIYQERAWEAFEHITAATISPYGYSAIQNVMRRGVSKTNTQESFWLAETLKYLFLIFDDPERISLDEWVFNTEAHPLKRERKVNWD